MNDLLAVRMLENNILTRVLSAEDRISLLEKRALSVTNISGGGSATAAGNAGNVQYKDLTGVFAGSDLFNWDNDTTKLYIGDGSTPLITNAFLEIIHAEDFAAPDGRAPEIAITSRTSMQGVDDTAGYLTFTRTRALTGSGGLATDDLLGRMRWKGAYGASGGTLLPYDLAEFGALATQDHYVDGADIEIGTGIYLDIMKNGSFAAPISAKTRAQTWDGTGTQIETLLKVNGGLHVGGTSDPGDNNLAVDGTINKITVTQPATGATLTIADGKTLTISENLTSNTGPGVLTWPASGPTTLTVPESLTVAGRDVANVFSQLNTFTSLKLSTGLIYPSADSTTALQVMAADGTTNIIDIDSTNTRVGIGGITAPLATAHISGQETLSLFIDKYNASLANTPFIFRASRGTRASPASPQAGDIIAGLAARPYDSDAGAFVTAARAFINFFAAETIGTAGSGTYMTAGTNPVGSTVVVTRLWLNETGLTVATVPGGAVAPKSTLDLQSITGSTLTLSRYDSSVTAADEIGRLNFWGNDTSLTTQKLFASLVVTATSTVTTDAAAGTLKINVTGSTAGGAPIEHMQFVPTTVAKIGFFGAAAVVQPANTAAIDTALINLGLRASGGSAFFDLRLALPMGEIGYFSTTGTAVAIATVSDGSTNMVKAVVTTTLNNDKEFDNGGANNGRLRYTGTTTRTFHVACTVSMSHDGANDIFVLGLAKNGTVDADCKVLQKITVAGDTQSTAMHCMISLATNDYIELYVGNISDADDCIINTLNIFAMGM